MPAIKSISIIAEKWARVTPQRAADFELGVKNPRRPWKESAKAAESTYEAGIQAGIARKAFGKGVEAAGNEKWQRRSVEVGPTRFAQGVQVAQPDYEKGFAKYRDVIEKTTLPPRYPKSDPRNIDRVKVMADALAKAKRV